MIHEGFKVEYMGLIRSVGLRQNGYDLVENRLLEFVYTPLCRVQVLKVSSQPF